MHRRRVDHVGQGSHCCFHTKRFLHLFDNQAFKQVVSTWTFVIIVQRKPSATGNLVSKDPQINLWFWSKYWNIVEHRIHVWCSNTPHSGPHHNLKMLIRYKLQNYNYESCNKNWADAALLTATLKWNLRRPHQLHGHDHNFITILFNLKLFKNPV